MGGELRGAGNSGPVAIGHIVANPALGKIMEPIQGRLLAHAHVTGHDIGPALHARAQPPLGQIIGVRPACRPGPRPLWQRDRWGHVAALHGVPIGRIDPVHAAGFGLDGPGFMQQMACMAMGGQPLGRKLGLHSAVA